MPTVYAHEIGDVIDQAAGEILLNGVTRQAQQVYNTLNSGAERIRNLTGPQHLGYSGDYIPRTQKPRAYQRLIIALLRIGHS